MGDEIKNIPTFYDGHKFRSRLEARWAVFFNAAGLRYQYEKEGFSLSNGKWYLPDFYLPDINYWVEVKDSACKQETFVEDMKKVSCMILDKIADNFIILSDIPYATMEKNVFWFPAIHRSLRQCSSCECDRVTFLNYAKCYREPDERAVYIQDDFYEGVSQKTYNIFFNEYTKPIQILPTFISPNPDNYDDISVNDSFAGDNDIVTSAYNKASSSRFEHGERG